MARRERDGILQHIEKDNTSVWMEEEAGRMQHNDMDSTTVGREDEVTRLNHIEVESVSVGTVGGRKRSADCNICKWTAHQFGGWEEEAGRM